MSIPTPDQLFADLFEQVQLNHVFADSKTFVDATPRRDPGLIVAAYEAEKGRPDFDLSRFVADNFDWSDTNRNAGQDQRRPIRDHIEALWKLLWREGGKENPYSSLITLPKSYLVPGGRFLEIFYWDSYFTMLGLAAADKREVIEDMVDDFAYLVDQIGFIPNGNRSYFCTRSQPPFFAMMVELLAEAKSDESVLVRYLPQLTCEHAFWMDGYEELTEPGTASRRVVRLDGGLLNRYWDDSDTPRQESYAEDTELAAASDRPAPALFRDIRAACESGWDFSSRWFEDPNLMETVCTTQVVPVDLNALMVQLEAVLARASRLSGDTDAAAAFAAKAEQRKRILRELFFDTTRGYFCDLLLPDFRLASTLSLAGAYPLYLGIATPDQAAGVARKLSAEFLKPGGWVTTFNHSGQQWDAPNGWAPLQWIVYTGLNNYGYSDAARDGARRWVDTNLDVYTRTGNLVEKYDVEHPGALASGGEYSNQSGFGWTNGVLLKLLDELGL